MIQPDSNAPVIDFDHLNLYTGGDVGITAEILSLFRSQIRDWVTVTEPSLSDQHWKEKTHTLKGAARGVGAWTLAEQAETAESLVGGEQTTRRATILAEMAAEIERVDTGISAFLSQAAERQTANTGTSYP